MRRITCVLLALSLAGCGHTVSLGGVEVYRPAPRRSYLAAATKPRPVTRGDVAGYVVVGVLVSVGAAYWIAAEMRDDHAERAHQAR